MNANQKYVIVSNGGIPILRPEDGTTFKLNLLANQMTTSSGGAVIATNTKRNYSKEVGENGRNCSCGEELKKLQTQLDRMEDVLKQQAETNTSREDRMRAQCDRMELLLQKLCNPENEQEERALIENFPLQTMEDLRRFELEKNDIESMHLSKLLKNIKAGDVKEFCHKGLQEVIADDVCESLTWKKSIKGKSRIIGLKLSALIKKEYKRRMVKNQIIGTPKGFETAMVSALKAGKERTRHKNKKNAN